MGAWVSDHAVVDYSMKTLHLFTGVEVSKYREGENSFSEIWHENILLICMKNYG